MPALHGPFWVVEMYKTVRLVHGYLVGTAHGCQRPNKKPRIEGEHDPGSRKEGYPHRQDG